jgi:peptidoglycan/LPS O-acetylase OafA/YrhL
MATKCEEHSKSEEGKFQRRLDSSNDAAADDATERFYHPELDGLRFLAFGGGFLHHAFLLPTNESARGLVLLVTGIVRSGETGVDLFLVLSAYLITELLLREKTRCGRVDVLSFYIRRGLRIWPLYFSFVAFAISFEATLIGNQGLPWPYSMAFLCFAGNWAAVVTGTLPKSTALILWSVSIEEQFYLVWPMLVRIWNRTGLLWLAIGLWVLGVTVRIFLVSQGATYVQINFNTLARLDAIAAGAMVACLLNGGTLQLSSLVRRSGFAVAVVGIVTTTICTRVLPASPWAAVFSYAFYAVCFGVILCMTLQPIQQTRGILASRLLVFLGRIS